MYHRVKSKNLKSIDKQISIHTLFFSPSSQSDERSLKSIQRTIIQDSLRDSDHPLSMLLNDKNAQLLNLHFEPFINERSTTGKLIQTPEAQATKKPFKNFISRNMSHATIEVDRQEFDSKFTTKSFFGPHKTLTKSFYRSYQTNTISEYRKDSTDTALDHIFGFQRKCSSQESLNKKQFLYTKRVQVIPFSPKIKNKKKIDLTALSNLLWIKPTRAKIQLKKTQQFMHQQMALVQTLNSLPKFSPYKQTQISHYVALLQKMRLLQKKVLELYKHKRKVRIQGTRFLPLSVLLLLNTPAIMNEINQQITSG